MPGETQITTTSPPSKEKKRPTSTMPKKKHKPTSLSSAVIVFLAFSTIIDHVVSDDSDVMALLAKSITPTPSGWSGSDYCHWAGVSCGTSSKVSSINLSSKSLSGNIPKDINQLSGLKSLSLQRNRFTGPLPSLSNMDSLEDINLDDNSFDSIPQGFLSSLTSLQSFSMNDNSNLPPWTIPDTLKGSTPLASFFASKANIVGEIPDIFGSFPNLQSLRLSYNNITGSLPASFYNSRIQNLWLNNQGTGLLGSIDVLGSMTQSQQIWLHGNRFSGPIPDLSACTGLTDLQLRNNLLTGVIPDSLTKLPKLQSVALQNNKFQGPMPSFPGNVQANLGTQNNFCLPTPGTCDPQVTTLLAIASAVFYPMTLAESWKGNDACQGWKFVTCESGSVTMINFGRQNWTGMISPAFANLTNLKSLLLNDNQLDGTIPEILTGLKQLRLLDISNNNVSGKVPAFPSSVTIKVSGNVFIGKDVPVSPRGKNSSSTNTGGNVPSPVTNNEADSSSMSPWTIVILVGAVLVLVLAISGFLIFKHRYNKRGKGDKLQASKRTSDNGISGKEAANDVNYTEKNMKINSINSSTTETPIGGSVRDKNDYHVYDGGNITIPIEALREATDNFSEHNILGKGGFGIVYSGKLDDGTRIAVKRMEASLINDKGMNEFKAEIEVLTKVRHRHLVSLHGFCDNGSERLLVYEYMPQGCLGRHLFDWKEMSVAPLTWNQRVTIALDVARGVEYLHSLAQQSFIHRDLKPSNILLGDDMRAKVADFGLVKSAPDGKYSLETKLAGTFGYLAPEYAATGRVTTKVDVFAFGVILMEIITGRKSLDDSQPEDRCHLVAWFRRLLADKEAVTKALDPVISSLTMDEEKFQSIWKVVELAGHCTAREPYQRPDMSHAVNVLAPLVEQWTPGPEDDDDGFGIDFNMSLPQVLQKWKANEDSSSAMSSDYYNGLTKDYSTSSNSTVEMIGHSRNTSSSDVRH